MIVFDVAVDSNGEGNCYLGIIILFSLVNLDSVPPENVYQCRRVLEIGSFGRDFALIMLDRVVLQIDTRIYVLLICSL